MVLAIYFKMTNVIIRKSMADDMKYVIKLIQELSEFENMPSGLQINAETLIKDGFGSSPPCFYCYVAETSEKEIVGYALYNYSYSTWLGKAIFLEDLYVQLSYRKTGIGKKLFLTVAEEAYKIRTRLDFQVLSWNPAIEFYKRMGAENLSETEQWNSFRLNLSALKHLFDPDQ